MQENITIARPYASAAFEIAREKGNLEAWSTLLNVLSGVVSDSNIRELIHDPRLGQQRQVELILAIVGDYAKFESAENYIRVLIESKRIGLSQYIAKLYEDMRDEAEGVAHVRFVSAYAIDAEQEETIANAIEKKLNKKLKVTTELDPNLIGGAVIRYKDKVFDLSLRGRLSQLTSQFS